MSTGSGTWNLALVLEKCQCLLLSILWFQSNKATDIIQPHTALCQYPPSKDWVLQVK